MDIKEGLNKVISRQDLTIHEMKDVMTDIMEGKATNAQIAGFLVALRMKGETIDEITGAAQVMREKSLKVRHKLRRVVDTCGTGGDSTGTFNISTVSAFVSAAAGAVVAKHGNRSVSSKSGSADVLEALGVNIDIDEIAESKALDEFGITFLYAVNHHRSMKYAIATRKELGVRTLFNALGPLTNPASASIQLVGVYDGNIVVPIAHALSNLGVSRAMVVHGEDGLDEITVTGKTKVAELKNGKVQEYEIDVEDYFQKRDLADLKGGNSKENAEIMRKILSGEEKGAKREIVLMNSGVVLYLSGIAESIKEGILLAEDAVDSGKAINKLAEYIDFTNSID